MAKGSRAAFGRGPGGGGPSGRAAAGSSTDARLANLYYAHVGEARRLAYLLTGDPERAEHIADAAFIRVAGRFGNLRAPEDFDGDVRKKVLSLARGYLRRLRLERKHDPAPRETEIPASETSREAWEKLQKLRGRGKAAVVLHYYEDLSEQQTADALGCSAGAVRSLTTRAMESLRVGPGGAEMLDPAALRDAMRAHADRIPSRHPIPPGVLRKVRRRRVAIAAFAGAVLLGVVGGTPWVIGRITDRTAAIEQDRPTSEAEFPAHPTDPGTTALAGGVYPNGDAWVLYAAVERGAVRMGSWRPGFPWTAWKVVTRLPVTTKLLKGYGYVSFESDGFVTVEGITSSDAEEARIELEEGAPITIRLIDAPPGLGASVKFIESTMPLGVRGRLTVSYADGSQRTKVLRAHGGEAVPFAEDYQRAYLGCLYSLERRVSNPRRIERIACENADPADFEPQDIQP